jgi:hypothetical protein
MPTCTDSPRTIGEVDGLATYWDEPPAVRARLVTGLAELVNELNRCIDDGYEGVAWPTDSAAFLLRQLAHARRRLR